VKAEPDTCHVHKPRHAVVPWAYFQNARYRVIWLHTLRRASACHHVIDSRATDQTDGQRCHAYFSLSHKRIPTKTISIQAPTGLRVRHGRPTQQPKSRRWQPLLPTGAGLAVFVQQADSCSQTYPSPSLWRGARHPPGRARSRRSVFTETEIDCKALPAQIGVLCAGPGVRAGSLEGVATTRWSRERGGACHARPIIVISRIAWLRYQR